MIEYVMVLYLTVTDIDTGKTLLQSHWRMSSGIDHCREIGVENAQILTKLFRKKYPNASTNVACKWEEGTI